METKFSKPIYTVKSIIDEMFEVRTSIHKEHLATSSYAEHIALNEFYDGILEITDRFAEAYQGRFNTRIYNSSNSVEIVSNLRKKLQEYILSLKQDKELENIIAEAIEQCDETLYKLTLK